MGDSVALRADGAPARLLVVEDEAVLVDLLTDALRFVGYDVESATTAADALHQAGHWRPDLVILDINLPDVDGFEVCRRLRAGGDQVPVIFLTARGDRADLRTGFSEGGDDYITKPQILRHVWQYDFGGDASVVETYISYLRRKLGPEGAALIRTVRGFGYTLREG